MAGFIYDLETTGPKADTARPVQIGALAFDDNLNTRIVMNTLCNPFEPIPEGASNVHGITDDQVQHMPDYLSALYMLRQTAEAFCPEGAVFGGYNHISYDNTVVHACLNWPGIFSHRPQLDLLQAMFRYRPDLESHKLGAAHLALTGYELVGAHGAIQDCLGCVEILKVLCNDLGMTPSQIADDLSMPEVYAIMPFGKYKGQSTERVPRNYAQFMLRKGDLSPDLNATMHWIANER